MSEFVLKTTSLLALSLISSFAYFVSKKYKMPYTLFLVFVGILISLVAYIVPQLHFLTSFELTPEILFYVFLPTLLFEAAYNIKVSYLVNLARPIFLLAVFGLVVSAFTIAGLLYFILPFIGINIPFEVALLFGAIISATDPVAVIALFKEYAAPKRLTILFEGESLFNDGTAVALFLIVLSVIQNSDSILSAGTALEGVFVFFSMIVLGLIIGVLFGIVFSKLIHILDDSKSQITLFLLAAHLSFVIAEIINEHFAPVSAIITTATTAIIMGNYGRYKLTPDIDNYISKFWEYFAFIANSLVFVLLGFLVLKLDFINIELILAAVVAILVVVFARAFSVYAALYFAPKEGIKKIPNSWKILLSWGSLRGALAIVMVLLIPDNLTMRSWELDISIKEFVMALVILSIYFTLFVKGLSMSAFMKWLNITKFGHYEKMSYLEAKNLAYQEIIHNLEEISKNYSNIDDKISKKIQKVKDLRKSLSNQLQSFIKGNKELLYKTLLSYAIGIEKNVLEKLYEEKQITEKAYKKFISKLEIQEAMLEAGVSDIQSFDKINTLDFIEKALMWLNRVFISDKESFGLLDKYTYYLALKEAAEKVVCALDNLSKEIEFLKDSDSFVKIKNKYKHFLNKSSKKLDALIQNNPEIKNISNIAIKDQILCLEGKYLQKLVKNKLISSKIEDIIKKEIESEMKDII